MYKVFVDKSYMLFKKNEKFSTNVEKKYLPSLKPEDLNSFKSFLNSDTGSEEWIIEDNDPYDRLQKFFKQFKWIEAAGGMVKNTATGEYLFIYRNGVWDLPKGKIEKNESSKAAAVREIQEECGLNKITVLNSLPDTFHVYHAYGKYWIKKTHWFSMETEELLLTPQQEEGITEAKWMKKEEVQSIIKTTYPSLIEVINRGMAEY